MDNPKQNPYSLASARAELTAHPTWAARHAIGLSVFVAFDVAFLGYLFVQSSLWFLLPIVAFALAWRIVNRSWPFLSSRQ